MLHRLIAPRRSARRAGPADVLPAPLRRGGERPADGAGTCATEQFDPRGVDRRRPSYCARLHPDPAQGAVYGLPLLTLGGELRAAFFCDPVVLPPASVLRCRPLRRDITLALEPVQ